MHIRELINQYEAGPDLLRQSLHGMTAEALDARPVPGQWSTRQVVCHIADFEIVYADRIKRVLAEHEPTLFGGDPDEFAAGLAYDRRDVSEEIEVIAAVRRQVVRILRTVPPESFSRQGRHTERGPLSLEVLLRQITDHLPHHVRFIEEKRRRMPA